MFKGIAACTLSIALSLVAVPVTAQQSRWAPPGDPVAKSLIDGERRWAEAACDGNLEMQSILASDFYGTTPDNARYSKSDEIASVKSAKQRDRDCRLGAVKIHFFGNSLALLYGSETRIAPQSDGTSQKQTLVWTDTWINRNGTWQIVAAQDNWAHEKR
jgi:hypothetical protein